MKRTSPLQVLMAIVLVLGVLMACKKKEEATATTGATAESTGVPECDEYLNKYEKCIRDKTPAVARPQLEQGMKTTRDSYKQLASNPATKASLPDTCKQALEATKTAMASYGCEW